MSQSLNPNMMPSPAKTGPLMVCNKADTVAGALRVACILGSIEKSSMTNGSTSTCVTPRHNPNNDLQPKIQSPTC